MGGLNPAGGHSCMELLARASHTSYLLQYLCTPIPLLPSEPKLVTRYHLAHHQLQIFTHRYIFVLLNVFSLLPTQSPVGGEVGVTREKRWEKLGICSICSVQHNLSRLRSPLLSGAVLPDPDLELAEATVEETSISKKHEHEERYNHETVIVCLLVEAWT